MRLGSDEHIVATIRNSLARDTADLPPEVEPGFPPHYPEVDLTNEQLHSLACGVLQSLRDLGYEVTR